MRLAIPVMGGRLAMHFGHCEQFAFVDVNPEEGVIKGVSTETAPPHEPGALPRWLGEREVGCVLAGGMGQRAVELLEAQGIEVIIGLESDHPENLARAYLLGSLQSGPNVCDH